MFLSVFHSDTHVLRNNNLFIVRELTFPVIDISSLLVAVVKAKNVVTLIVDGVTTEPGIGTAGVSATDTNDPLYIGGRPGKNSITYEKK